MPYSHYMATREPPTLRDRFYFDPLGIAVAASSGTICALLVLSAIPGVVGSRSLEGLHWSALALIAAAMLVGSLRYLHGAMAPRKSWSKLDIMRVTRGGAVALSCAWGGYSLAILWSGNSAYAIVLIITGLVAVGYAGKARSLHLSERTARTWAEAGQASGG